MLKKHPKLKFFSGVYVEDLWNTVKSIQVKKKGIHFAII